MSLAVDGVWKAGLWAQTLWADGVWREGALKQQVAGFSGGFAYPLDRRKRHKGIEDEPAAEPECAAPPADEPMVAIEPIDFGLADIQRAEMARTAAARRNTERMLFLIAASL